jgi:Uma2 family endonuclease
MSALAQQHHGSFDDFLAWEQGQLERYELVDGIVRLMAGGTEGHDRIAGNIFANLHMGLRGTPCSAHATNLKVVAGAAGAVMYPDAFVRYGPRDDRRTAVDDPVVVFEVLSEGTAKHDLIRKRRAYETIASLRRIVFVDPDAIRIDMRVRGADGLWVDETIEGLDATLELPEIGAAITLTEIYASTEIAALTSEGVAAP